MTFALTTIIVRSRRRVRAIFSEPVAAGAFNASFFSIVSLDGVGASPGVNAALLVPDSAQCVELSLATELADGGNYELDVAAGVPALAGGTAGAAAYRFQAPSTAAAPSPELPSDEALDAIYGNDIVFASDDFVETPAGDLALSGGIQNVVDALITRSLSEGLPWDGEYGAKPREFVDGDATEIPLLRARIIAQALEDDRVTSATGTSVTAQTGDANIEIDVILVGQSNPLTVQVPNENA